MIRRPPRSTQSRSSAASDVYKRQELGEGIFKVFLLEVEHIASYNNDALIIRCESLLKGIGHSNAEMVAFLEFFIIKGIVPNIIVPDFLGIPDLFGRVQIFGDGHRMAQQKFVNIQGRFVATVSANRVLHLPSSGLRVKMSKRSFEDASVKWMVFLSCLFSFWLIIPMMNFYGNGAKICARMV